MDKSFNNIKRTRSGMIYSLILTLVIILVPGVTISANNEEVLMVINDRKISKSEFIHLWEKNNLYAEYQSPKEYLELFQNFHLKVAQAMDEGLHLNSTFINELSGYRKQLAAPYLGDPGTEEILLEEAHERMQYDVNASHILVRLLPGFSPDDTLKAWEKAMQIRSRILGGENFEVVARATSDDPSAKTNSGNLGYFTVFQMAYPFENEVHSAEIGELSMPVLTRFGYHIIRVNDKRKSLGELKTAHIMIGFNQYDEFQAEQKVADIYKDLLAGHSFEALAENNSTDMNSVSQGGALPWFGVGRVVPEFEEAAFALRNPDDISAPVRTPYGWHIIKLLDRREIPPLEDIKSELLDMVRNSRDERSQMLRDALVTRLKKEWQFSENPAALEIFYRIVDESVFSGNWAPPSNLPLNQALFRVTGKSATQREFADFISENAFRRNPWPLNEYILSLYGEFVGKWLTDHEESNLENKYEDFRFLMQEYKDGMLLFEITEREVWSRAISDSAGLAAFHRQNRNDYMWDTRVSASIFSTEDSRAARITARRANRSKRFSGRDDNWVIDRINRNAKKDAVTVEKGIFTRGENNFTDNARWTEGASDIFEKDNKYHIVLIHNILAPEPKTLEEARGEVISDYQDYLEGLWVEELRKKYNVVVYNDVLTDIK